MHKNNEEIICGWANQNQINEDTIRLTNILKRKKTVDALPQINVIKNKEETLHRKQFSNIKLGGSKDILQHTFKKLKIKREKTEGYDNGEIPYANFNNQKIFKAIKKETQNPLSISPYLTDIQSLEVARKNSKISSNQASPVKAKREEKEKDRTSFFQTLKQHTQNIKSHDFIQQYSETALSPKKTDSRFYVKLSALEMVNGLKKELQLNNRRNLASNVCMSEEREYKPDRSKRKKIGAQVLQRINEKFRSTFTKTDIFNKIKRRSDNRPEGKQEIHDPLIFSQNSIIFDKNSPQSKLRTFPSPPKSRLIFK